jgi:hypothetical protein
MPGTPLTEFDVVIVAAFAFAPPAALALTPVPSAVVLLFCACDEPAVELFVIAPPFELLPLFVAQATEKITTADITKLTLRAFIGTDSPFRFS